MAVKCNIPGLALQQIKRMLYGFDCTNVSFEIIENYLEYLNCPLVDHQPCQDFPCVVPEGDVTCDISGVNLAVTGVTYNSVTITFIPPSQPYVVSIYDVVAQKTVLSVPQATSPVVSTTLSNNIDYLAVLTLNCAGGESKEVQVPFHTLPICVTITDFTGTPAITP